MENYKEHACDVLYDYISELKKTDKRFNTLISAFYNHSYDAAMTSGYEHAKFRDASEDAYCKTVNYLLKKNRPLVMAVLGTDNYPDMFVRLIPFLRE